MISISMPVRDIDGSVVIHNTYESSFGEIIARVTRTPTLDGGAVIDHSGVSAGDRIYHLDSKITKDQEVSLKYIFNNTQYILVSVSDGLFYGAFSQMKIEKSKVKAIILIKQKEN